jgi:chemotaxis protein histidine kinase CheA
MSGKNKYKIFTSTDCLSEQTMFDYIDGKLNPGEQHIVEKHLLDCELCSDAMEGLQLLKNRSRITTINKEIDNRIDTPERKIFSINYPIVISIAAAFLLLIGGVYFFNHFVPDNTRQNNVVSDLKAPKEKESGLPPSFENDPANQSPAVSDHLEEPGKEKDKAGKMRDDKEPVISAEQEAEKNTVNEVTMDEEIATTAQPVPDQNNKDIATSGAASQTQTITPDKSISKNDDADYYYKTLPAESKNGATSESNAPVEQSVTKSAEEFNALKTEPKEKTKENKKREQSQRAAATIVPYAPQSVTQMDVDQAKAIDSINIPEEPVYTKVDKMPEFPGGNAELLKYIRKNIDLTKWTIENENTIGFTVQFVVNSLGQATKAKLLKPANKENEKQIVELISKMPLWAPAQLNGKPVSVLYTLPVTF